MRTLLIDGDIIAYKAAFAAEKNYEWEEGIWSTSADLHDATTHFDALILEMEEKLKADEVVIALTHEQNWRKDIYPAYKAPRAKVRRPILLKPLRKYAEGKYATFERPTLEADDVLGILSTASLIKGEKIICTIDKDLLQIPGKHWNIDKRTKKTVTELEGSRLHLLQTLTGDMVDNYPGLPGCGKVTAEKILGASGDEPPWDRIVHAYEAKGLSEDDALIQARVSRICRASDYDFTARAVRLWCPPDYPHAA